MTNLNVSHSVTLTEGQISVILYHLEGKDGEEINSIFQTLEGTIDSYYSRQSEAKSIQNPSEIGADTSYASAENKRLNIQYDMEHTSEGC